MKILHIINTLSAGGAELHLLTLSRNLRARGFELVVACLREKVAGSRSLRKDFEAEGIKVINFEGHNRLDKAFLLRTFITLRQERPDVLHTHLPRADFAGLVSRLVSPKIAWVASIHNIYSEYWSGKWALPILNFAWRKPDSIIAISKAVKEWLVDNQGLSPEKIHLVYYGLDPQKPFTRDDNLLRPMEDIDSNKMIGSIGRLEPRKGHETLIEAMPFILKRVPNAHLLIAGHDPWEYGKNLQSLIDRLGLNNRVQLTGFQSDVEGFLDMLDVFAFASVSEGFGQVLIEAMASAKPIVATDIPPINEIVEHEGSGLLVPPTKEAFAEAITNLLLQPERSLLMGKQGKNIVGDRFSSNRMTEETVAVYKQVLQRSGRQKQV